MRRERFRILMTTDAVGGVWTYACELTHALCQHGHEVLLVVMGPPPQADQVEALTRIAGLRVKITDLALEWLDPQGADTDRAHDQLLRIAGEFQPDIVHLNSFREGAFDWPWPVVVVAHSCVRTWWQACRGSVPDEARWHVYERNVAAGLDAADAWVAPTAAFQHDMASSYRLLAEGRVIRNGLDIGPARLRRKQPFILAAGRLWDEAKNIRTLLGCAPALPWWLRVAGPTELPGNKGGASAIENVKWLGALPHDALMRQMEQASIFVAPALYEPFGLTVLEAAAYGCALILADLPSFRELWGDAALFVEPHNDDALTSALQSICRDEDLRRHLQTAARERARRYSRAAMLQGYQQLYHDVGVSRGRAIRRGEPVLEARA